MPYLTSSDSGKAKLWRHIIVWLIYTAYIYTTNYMVNKNVQLIHTIFFLVPHYTTFYIIYYFLNLPAKRKIFWGIIIFIAGFPVLSAAGYIYFFYILPLINIELYSENDVGNFLHSAGLSYVQFFAFATLYYYFTGVTQKERELRIVYGDNARIEQEKIKQELDNALLREKEAKARQEKLEFEFAFLHSQINPHFLYNTLNVLLSQAIKVSPGLADNISKMSEMIRYSMESVEYRGAVVSMEKELENLQILIDINTMRFGKSCFIDYSIEGHVEGQLIPPLVCITVVENAFKYGDIKDSSNPLNIRVRLRPGHLYFYCRNKKKKNGVKIPSHNIGIRNLRQRLDVSFNDRYHIETINEEEFYTFELTINSI